MKLFMSSVCRIAAAVLFFAVTFAMAENTRIASVETDGNITINVTKILSVIQSRPGQVFSDQSLTADCQSIAAIEGVEYAYYSAVETDGGMAVTFVIVEQKLVREIAFYGNHKLKDGFLRKELKLRIGDYLDNLEIGRAITQIRETYAKKGYYFAGVEIDKEAITEGRVIFKIEESPRVKIAGVRFEGNNLFSSNDLKKVVKLKKRKFIFFSVYLSDKSMDEDIARVLDVYGERGYIDAVCTTGIEFNDKLNRAVVVFKITEGAEYTAASINISGNEFFSAAQLSEDVRLLVNDVYNSKFAEFDRKTIEDKYLETGFVDAKVALNRRYAENNSVDVEYAVKEGERFRIGRIEVTGNQTTHDKVVRRELEEVEFSPGQWYNAALARGDGKGTLETNVKRASLAESVLITPVDGDPGQKTAVVDITEGRTGMVMFGAGIDSSNGVIGQIILEQRNFDITDWPESFGEFIRGQAFKGAGQRLRISLEPGTEVTRYSIDFTDPYVWDRPMELNVGSSRYERGRESYDEERFKGYFGFTRRYKDGWAIGMRFRAENVDIDADADAPQEVQDCDGGNNLFGTKFLIIKNNTDSRYLPTKGDSYEVNYEQVFGDYNFGVATGIYRWYKTLTEDLARRKTVLSTKLQASSIIGDAPVFEKFYAGGTGSLRGFDYRGVSPRGESLPPMGRFKDPIGSDWLVLANAEIAVPLGSDTFNWLFFTDTGMIEEGGLRSAVGTGIEILLPQWFGPVPMRFELGMPITKEDEDDTRVFSFSMGRLF